VWARLSLPRGFIRHRVTQDTAGCRARVGRVAQSQSQSFPFYLVVRASASILFFSSYLFAMDTPICMSLLDLEYGPLSNDLSFVDAKDLSFYLLCCRALRSLTRLNPPVWESMDRRIGFRKMAAVGAWILV
jgi:hypothetical protein